MLRIRDISMYPGQDEGALVYEAAKALRISALEIRSLQIARRSVDARKKPDVRIIYTVDVTLKSGEDGSSKNAGTGGCPQPLSRVTGLPSSG